MQEFEKDLSAMKLDTIIKIKEALRLEPVLECKKAVLIEAINQLDTKSAGLKSQLCMAKSKGHQGRLKHQLTKIHADRYSAQMILGEVNNRLKAEQSKDFQSAFVAKAKLLLKISDFERLERAANDLLKGE